MKINVILAVFKRNFFSYFSSPIGYVFICAFVLLSAFAAFWPHAFFNANLANLDQLNQLLPLILLVFIPAITMSIWAEERRQGTDELLLTLPAEDLEIVIGKYLAALATYTVALLFSLSNIAVLIGLGEPDIGLLVANYLGYFFMGAGMIAIGMVASFLTNNLTVGFILAVAFNAPLAFAGSVDAILGQGTTARLIQDLSLRNQFADFGRGVVSLSSIVFFLSIAAVMLYLAMVLIGRRHWAGRVSGLPFWLHYAVRAACALVVAVGVIAVAARFDVRWDLTSERLSSLSPETMALLEVAGEERPVLIEAYITPNVPEEYVQTRLNLLAMLREFDIRGGDRVVVRVNDTEPYSDAAAEAREQFSIAPRPVATQADGRFSVEEIHLGVAVMSGLDKVVIPFIDRGLSPEYELIRSVTTVSAKERLRLGVLATDAELFGGFDMDTFQQRPDQPIVAELRKQFDVVPVDATAPIPLDLDVLLAVQPSSLPQAPLSNFIDAVRRGMPTALFEDPFPSFGFGRVPATSQPRRPRNPNPFSQQPPPEPKGDFRPLWSLLQVRAEDDLLVWDRYNPYPRLVDIPPEFIFVGAGSGNPDAFAADSPITNGLQEMLLAFPSRVTIVPNAQHSVTPLLRAGTDNGTVLFDEVLQQGIFGPTGINPNRRLTDNDGPPPVLSAWIRGTPEGTVESTPAEINVIYTADIDCLYPVFFNMRATGPQQQGINAQFDNVTFALNVLDSLAGDERFIEIRKRRPRHRTLTSVERKTEAAREQANAERESFLADFDRSRDEETIALENQMAELNARTDIDPQQKMLEAAMLQEAGQSRLDATIERLERQRDEALATVEQDLSQQVRRVQNSYKLAAIAVPPIPPLILAVIVFIRRRRQERIGVPTSRLR